ncbi:MAG: xanthine dehydrogenase molybdopterin binding subunit [Deltaproteobacteria bacterium]|nr:xanthine dehydrogenase molybdopterin binding subunit [Deltaproteobacteria bacterium]
MNSPLHRPALHESGHRHANGEALYVDDLPPPRGMLHGLVYVSPVAHGKILRLDVSAARALPGVHAVLTAADIPGHNDIAPVGKDEPLLATDTVHCVGQHVALIVAESLAQARRAQAAIVAEYQPLPAILSLKEAMAAGSYLTQPHLIRRGDVQVALQSSALVLEGEVETGAQDHFYLETQVALVVPEEEGGYRVWSSTQHPSEVQAKVAEIMGLARHQVVVETPRMGGGFGGKETQGAHFAALAALGAGATRRPVKVWLNRDQDMTQTGKRHPFHSKYRCGFDRDGKITGLWVETHSDGGWSLDLSRAILDRCLFHLDNAYYLPNLHFSGRVCRTHQPSNTAFRGFGGPQGVAVIEVILERAALALGLDSAEIRARNYYGPAPRDRTPYDQEVKDCRLDRIHRELLLSADYQNRLAEVAAYNQTSRYQKRGLAFQPVKFGISFTHSMLNQAGALVLIYADGSVQVNHGGTEMGQGLQTKIRAIAAHELGLLVEQVRVMTTATDKVPNTSATAASSGADLNGAAVKLACETLRERLSPVARSLLGIGEAEDLSYQGGTVRGGGRSVSFGELAAVAYARQISLSATGYYRTPDIRYDPAIGRGKPFHYFAYGAAVVEVEVSGLTGEHKVRRVDILHDVGDSLVPTIDVGQIEGGFIQGLGWLTTEELVVDAQGRLLTHSPDTYKIPTAGDAPRDFRVALLTGAPQADVVHGSKAVGEPPLMLAIGVVSALRRAIDAFRPGAEVTLAIPCTPESVLRAITSLETHESGGNTRAIAGSAGIVI